MRKISYYAQPFRKVELESSASGIQFYLPRSEPKQRMHIFLHFLILDHGTHTSKTYPTTTPSTNRFIQRSHQQQQHLRLRLTFMHVFSSAQTGEQTMGEDNNKWESLNQCCSCSVKVDSCVSRFCYTTTMSWPFHFQNQVSICLRPRCATPALLLPRIAASRGFFSHPGVNHLYRWLKIPSFKVSRYNS